MWTYKQWLPVECLHLGILTCEVFVYILEVMSMICTFFNLAATAAKLLQSCPTLCDPIDGSPPGSAIPGILQARTLELVAISFSNAWKWKVKMKSLSRVRLLATPWTAAYQAPLSMGLSRQEYWSGVPLWTNLNLPIPVFHSPFVRQSDNFQFYIDKFSLLFLMGPPNEVDW